MLSVNRDRHVRGLRLTVGILLQKIESKSIMQAKMVPGLSQHLSGMSVQRTT